MRKLLVAAGALLALCGGAANANTVLDATGDFLPTYTGPKTGDLDVTSFSVDFDAGASLFTLGATFADDINAANPGFYVIGVNTGTGPLHPFGPVGQGNVLFNQFMSIQKNGAGLLGANTFTAMISGKTLTAVIPLSMLTTTGFAPDRYGFNIWPRQVTGGLAALADFAPENSTLSAAPEPSAWALMIAGFGLAGAVLRRRRLVHG